MKLLTFQYHLKIRMDAPVSGHYFTLRCTPASDARQKIIRLQQDVFPNDYLSCGWDQWGNALLCGCVRAPHTSFEAVVSGQAETGASRGVPAGPFEKERIFQFETPLTKADGALKEFSEGLKVCSGSPEETAGVMRAVHEALSYEPGATTVWTTAAQAFALGRGVCQDYAHVMLAVLRDRGIPARYVAGMLLGEGESHAWVEVLHEGVWTAYDPANCVTVTDQHIKLSHGRDAKDCAINRGIFLGEAKQETQISVIVTEDMTDEERQL